MEALRRFFSHPVRVRQFPHVQFLFLAFRRYRLRLHGTLILFLSYGMKDYPTILINNNSLTNISGMHVHGKTGYGRVTMESRKGTPSDVQFKFDFSTKVLLFPYHVQVLPFNTTRVHSYFQ
jgi:hypothetical protein